MRIEYQRNYSQNQLKSSELIRRLVHKSSLLATDKIVEIGSGLGIITQELATVCKEVLAFEIDTKLFEKSQVRLKSLNNITELNEDFLTADLPVTSYKVFANIPFNLSSQIIKKVTEASNPPIDAYLIMQKEAAEKFMGRPKETQASLLVKPWFELSSVYTFQKSDFTPAPNVTVILLKIQRRKAPKVSISLKDLYKDFIVYSTTRWKKTLFESLEEVFTRKQLFKLAEELQFDIGTSPLHLNFDCWLNLFNVFIKLVDREKRKKVSGAFTSQRVRESGLKKINRTRLDRGWRLK